ncbi:PAS domain S-box protein [Actinoplanes awajinensis]|uniref:PAS domain S-box protein n=1 Tax=Actinoplanes awajinensis TaxID=135946 RepID=UPI000B2D98DD|nr:PAS domain S-box protein [Actinoplanes awajinensis]
MTLSVTAIFVLILLWVSWRYLRDRDPLLRDVIYVFAAVGMLFVLALFTRLVGEPSRSVRGLVSALLLAQPVLTLRLAGRLRPVPRSLLIGATGAWVLSALPVLVLPYPLPPHVIWPCVVAFFAVEATAAWFLAIEARSRGGAARLRLWAASGGTALFGVALLVAGGGQKLAADARMIALLSAILYLLAFVPPRWLRRTWSWRAAYTVMRRLLAAPADEPAARTWQCYCEGAARVLGADAVVVLTAPANGPAQVAGATGPNAGQPEFTRADLDELLTGRQLIDALAGWTQPPAVAVAFARATGTRFVTVAPVDTSDGPGALLVLGRYRSLFAEDDLAQFTELAGQAAALAGRAQALAERERLAVIVASSPDAIIATTVDGVITDWNTGAENLYGYPRTEAVGRRTSMLVHPGQREAGRQMLASIAGGERIEQQQVQRVRKDGSTVTVSLTLSPIAGSDGRIAGIASIARDLTARQRADARFEGLLEAAPDAIIGVTRDGTIALINAQAERLFGYQRQELVGQSVDILVPERLRGTHPHQRDSYFTEPKSRPMGAGQALTAVRKDGSEFPAEISLSALETEQGMIVSTAIRDVTDRMIAQAERERLIAQAERDASERRLQHTRRLESLGQLAGGVAHDFNNILAVITNYTELIIETLEDPAAGPEDTAAVRTDLDQIARAAERATRLTKQLLAFGRRDITQAQVLVLNHVIGDVEPMLRRTLGEHIHLVTTRDQQLWPVYADPGQIEQILVNLAVNARDAMPGGGTLSIDTTNADIDADDMSATNLQPGRYVRLRVSDTGTGMPADVIERAFEPFYTTKPKGSGTGLGLATVYGIATAAGGDVHLYSESGIGTTVTVVLPAVDVPADVSATDVRVDVTASAGPATETILLVEDEDALRQVAVRILSRAGYHVLAATGGAQAIHIAQTHPDRIDMMLTDVIMPKMMGNEVAARVQAIRPSLPVLYMSGYAEPVLTENGTLQDGVTIIEKPFTSRDLLCRVHGVLHRPAAGPDEREPLPRDRHPQAPQRHPQTT